MSPSRKSLSKVEVIAEKKVKLICAYINKEAECVFSSKGVGSSSRRNHYRHATTKNCLCILQPKHISEGCQGADGTRVHTETSAACGYVSAFDACGDDCFTTKKIYVEIVEFTTFVKFWTFDIHPNNSREKRLIDRISISAGVYLDIGYTKEFIDKNE
jgi:hypothetical protein